MIACHLNFGYKLLLLIVMLSYFYEFTIYMTPINRNQFRSYLFNPKFAQTNKPQHNIIVIYYIISKQLTQYMANNNHNKSNLLFIQSDSDSQDNQNQHSLKLKGNYRIESNQIKQNILHDIGEPEQYKYESVKSARKANKSPEKQYKQQQQVAVNQNTQQIMKPEGKQITYVASIFQSEDEEEQETNQQTNQQHKNMRTKTQSVAGKNKILKFEIDDDSDDSEGNIQDETVRQQIQNVVNQQSDQEKFRDQDEFSDSSAKNENQVDSDLLKLTPVSMIEDSNKNIFNKKLIPFKAYLDGEVRLSNFMYPQFDLVFKNYTTHICSSKKQSGSFGSNYYLSTQQANISLKNQNYLGKLRSTSEPDIYSIFDNGDRLIQKNSKNREVIATVCLTINKGPRKVEVYMLKQGVFYSTLKGYCSGSEIGLHKLYLIEENKRKIYHFKSRNPEWIPKFGKYFLDFGGKVKVASIKNFVLEDSETKAKVLLFGKSSDNCYNIEVWHPLSPWLALAIIVTQFENQK